MHWRKVLETLNPGGVAYFQVPTYRPGYSFEINSYIESPMKGSFEMHMFPQRSLFELLEDKGCRILEMRENAAAGAHRHFVSNALLVQKH